MPRLDLVIGSLREHVDHPRTFWSTAAVLSVTFVVLCYLTRVPGISTGGDDATYMLLAESLSQGTYRNLMLLGEPFHTTYPPVFPAWIAMLSLVGITSVNGVILVNCILVVAGLLLVADVVRRKWNAGVALAVLAVSVLNPMVLRWTGTVLAEALYLALSALTLWAVTRRGWQWTAVAGGAAVVAVMTRSIGVTLLASVVLVWMLHGHWKRALVWGLVGGVLVGAWFLWTNVAPTPKTYSVILGMSSTDAEEGLLAALWRYIGQNVGHYLPGNLFYALQYPSVEGTLADNLAWLLFTLAVGVPGIIGVWQKWPTLVGYLVTYFLLLLVWPWQTARLFMPVVPLVLVVLIVGLLDLARRLRRPEWGPVGVALLVALLAGSSLGEVKTRVVQSLACDRSSLYGERSCFKDSDQAFLAGAAYARASLPREAVVGTYKWATFAWYADLRVAGDWMFTLGSDGAIPDAFLSGDVQYVFLSQVSPKEWRIARALQVLCDHFAVVESFPHHTMLLRFALEPPGENANACQAIEDHGRIPFPG